MAEHRRLVWLSAVALALVAAFGGLYCAGWLRGAAGLDPRSHFKILPAEYTMEVCGEKAEPGSINYFRQVDPLST